MAGWESVDEINAYLLSVSLRDQIIKLADAGRFNRDFKLRDQICDSSASAPRNLSEGFDRFYHGEFGFFAGVAKASLGETINHLTDARTRGFVTPAECTPRLGLAEKARKATTGLLKHLLSTEAPGEQPRRKHRCRRPKQP